MLRIEWVWPRGVFSFGDFSVPIVLEKLGAVLFNGINLGRKGKSNGAGKSSFWNVLSIVLFDDCPVWRTDVGTRRRDIRVEHFTNWSKVWGNRGGFAGVGFSVPGGRYRVLLLRDWKQLETLESLGPSELVSKGQVYSGTGLFFEKWDGATWKDLRKATVDDTRGAIRGVLPLDYNEWTSIAYQCQGKVLTFLSGDRDKKSEILTSLTNYGDVDAARVEVKEDLKFLEKRISSLLEEARCTQAEIRTGNSSDLESLCKQRDSWSNELADIGAQIVLLEQEKAEKEALLSNFRKSLAVCHQELASLHNALFSVKEQLANLDTQFVSARAKIDGTRLDAVLQAEVILNSAIRSEAADQALVTQCQKEPGKCLICGSQVSPSALEEHRRELGSRYESARISRISCEAALDNACTLESSWKRGAVEDLENWRDGHRQHLNMQVAELESQSLFKNAQVTSLMSEIEHTDVSQASSRLVFLLSKKAQMSADIGWVSEDISAAAGLLEERSRLGKIVRSLFAEIVSLSLEASVLAALDWHFSDRGMKAYKYESIVSRLNTLMAENLLRLAEGFLQVRFTSWKKKGSASKKHDDELTAADVSPEFDILVSDDEKEGVPLHLYSGGEKKLIGIAIIATLFELYSEQTGGVNLMGLDEVFGDLDEGNVDAALEFVAYIRTKVETLCIVTHSSDIKARLIPDKVFNFVKKNGLTSIMVE